MTNQQLPRPAAEMRETILISVRSGLIADLKLALELNELKPEIADDGAEDAIAYLKRVSADGEGRDILAAAGKILDMRPAVLPLGRDIENNALYVWPYLAESAFERLTAEEERDLEALVPANDATAMKAAKRWTGWRLVIGADGTWHSFKRAGNRAG